MLICPPPEGWWEERFRRGWVPEGSMSGGGCAGKLIAREFQCETFRQWSSPHECFTITGTNRDHAVYDV